MTLKIYNTLTREKQDFTPLDESNVRMYVCGPTVYDYAHIGNARPVIVFDSLFRLLRHIYGTDKVTYVRNITDVDDKINARAAEEKISIRELTEKTAEQFHEDIAALKVLPPSGEPRATDHIAEMVTMISTLMEKGHAYEAEGHVLFDVSSDSSYGALSNRPMDDMMAGARVEVADYKKNPMDFVLWKPSTQDEPGWDSPWGRGRPGWHLECSAMSAKYLGESFDIHGGGLDLIFPHHENEIAQSTCSHGTKVMANYWMHNEYLNIEGEKMSKSLGNFVTINGLLKEWHGEVIRLCMMMTHYRQPISWSVKTLAEARKSLDQWYHVAARADIEGIEPKPEFIAALQDDLNIPKAIAILHELRRFANKGDKESAQQLKACAQFLGFMNDSKQEWRDWKPESAAEVDEDEINALVQARLDARDAKDWEEADAIRDRLVTMGVVLKDSADGTEWELG